MHLQCMDLKDTLEYIKRLKKKKDDEPRNQNLFFPTVDSQQLAVEDSDDTRALQAVGGSAALTLLEGCWQLLDLVPLTDVLQEKRRTFTHFAKIVNFFF